MANERVKVVIDKKGNVNTDLIGFNGVGCAELAAKLALNGRVLSETTKPEFYNSNGNENVITQ